MGRAGRLPRPVSAREPGPAERHRADRAAAVHVPRGPRARPAPVAGPGPGGRPRQLGDTRHPDALRRAAGAVPLPPPERRERRLYGLRALPERRDERDGVPGAGAHPGRAQPAQDQPRRGDARLRGRGRCWRVGAAGRRARGRPGRPRRAPAVAHARRHGRLRRGRVRAAAARPVAARAAPREPRAADAGRPRGRPAGVARGVGHDGVAGRPRALRRVRGRDCDAARARVRARPHGAPRGRDGRPVPAALLRLGGPQDVHRARRGRRDVGADGADRGRRDRGQVLAARPSRRASAGCRGASRARSAC